MSLLGDLINLVSGGKPYISPITDQQQSDLVRANNESNLDTYMQQKGFTKTGNNTFYAGALPTPTPTPLPQVLGTSTNDPGAQYNPIISQSAKQTGVPAPLLKGVLAHESMQFNPKYVSGYHTDGTGRGIGGIDKNAHPEVPDEDAFNPSKAIPWVANQLSRLYKEEGNWSNALRRYNGGYNYNSNQPGFEGVPVAKRTLDYANNVFKQMKAYAQ